MNRLLHPDHLRRPGHHDDCARCSSALRHHQLVCPEHKSAVQEQRRRTGITVFKEVQKMS